MRGIRTVSLTALGIGAALTLLGACIGDESSKPARNATVDDLEAMVLHEEDMPDDFSEIKTPDIAGLRLDRETGGSTISFCGSLWKRSSM